jgi:hypothetical protein
MLLQARPQLSSSTSSPTRPRISTSSVYQISQTLTDEQKRIADYWADGAGTVTPHGHWNVIAIDLLRDAGWSTLCTARPFAVLNTAQADAFIACWDTKFTYWSIRPIAAIRRLIDDDWLSYSRHRHSPPMCPATQRRQVLPQRFSRPSSPHRKRSLLIWPKKLPFRGCTAASTSEATTRSGSPSAGVSGRLLSRPTTCHRRTPQSAGARRAVR